MNSVSQLCVDNSDRWRHVITRKRECVEGFDVCVVVIVMIGMANFRKGVRVDALGIFFRLGVTVM